MRRSTLLPALASAALLVVALTGCGTTSTPTDETPAAAPAVEGCENDTTATSTGPVNLTDSFGRTVTLDAPAKRVAVLEWQQIEDVLTLCVTPVAVADAKGYTTWNSSVALPEGVTDVGSRQEPNLETLYAAKPDLVIVEAYTAQDEIIAQLEKYDVPVLATKGADAKDPIANMLATFDLIGTATGREERAKVVTAEFEKSLEEGKAAVAEAKLPTTRFVYFDGWIDGGNVSLRPFGQGSLVGEVGEALGLENAWTGEVDPAYGLGGTDVEGLKAIGDAQILYTGTRDGESDSFADAMTKNPIWASLPAVKEARVHAFPAGIWTFGGPRSTTQLIDAYVSILTK